MLSSLLLAVGVLGGALELDAGTFQEHVKDSGKNAFVKFLAPW
jgi:hypothetical protein